MTTDREISVRNEPSLQRNEDAQQSAQQLRERPSVAPVVDIYENRDEYLLYADLPGVEHGNVDINFDRGHLTITARRPDPAAEGELLQQEYRTVDFERAFKVPEAVDVENIAAKLNDGVLELRLPKSPEVRPRRIQISAG